VHHVVVKRVAVSLWAFIGLASLVFGWVATRTPAVTAQAGQSVAEAGRLAFDRDCGSCHGCPELASASDEAARLVDKLATHGPSSVEDDLAIVAYLVSDPPCSTGLAPATRTGGDH